jgi:hypothetical protein
MNNEVEFMQINKIDGIPSEVSNRVISAVHNIFKLYPDDPLNLQMVAMLSRVPQAEFIKTCLYTMLTCRMIKASFFPVHRDCMGVLDKEHISAFAVQEKIKNGEYEKVCENCGNWIISDTIEVGMTYWKLGATIK